MQNLQTRKNVQPVERETLPGKTENETHPEYNNIAPFCKDCRSVNSFKDQKDPDVFTDLYGFAWRCGDPLHCRHAITDGPVIFDCMILNAILKQAPGTLNDFDCHKVYRRRKFRAQLFREFKMITSIRAAV
jgi:hypothetical protein